MATPNIVPRADSEGGLGTASKYWAAAYIDTITTTGNIVLPDSAKLLLGAGSDLQIYHDGSNSYIIQATGAGGDFYIQNNTNDKDIIFKGKDGGSNITALTLDMSEAGAATFAADVSIAEKLIHTGDTDTFLQFGDNDIKLKAGGATYFHAAPSQTTFLYSGNSIALSLDTSQNATFAGTINGIPFYSDVANNSMYTHDVSGTDDTATSNTAYGFSALQAITTGDANVGLGHRAGISLTTGIKNILIGARTGENIIDGGYNIAIGDEALFTENGHGKNIAIGYHA